MRRRIASHPKARHVFLNDAGTPYSKDTLRRRLRRRSQRLKIKTVTPYSLRHTFACMLSEAGANQMSLAQLMGHTTVRTTARYVQNSDAYYRTAMDKQAQQLQAVLGISEGKNEK